jgi:TPR repeat protein
MVKLFYLVLISIMSITTNVVAEDDIGYKYYQKGNYEKALKIWAVEAEEGNKEAFYNIGLLYFFGNGVEKNLPLAFEYCQKAAFMGSPRAQNNLAFMYIEGLGVKKSYIYSYVWASIAIKHGYNSQLIRDDAKIQLTPAMLRDARKLFTDIIKDINNE